MKIGILSDTHGWLDPRIKDHFAGVGHILHAGDIGDAFIAFELEQIAPVTVVLGNTDLGLSFKETEVVELAGRKFLVHHIVNPHAPADPLKRRLIREKPDVVVFGHTHQAFDATLGGIRYFNPGYAGKPKFGTERSAAIWHCESGGVRADFLRL
jgi:putative phosphoesterase